MTRYQIQIQGRTASDLTGWFEEMEVQGAGETELLLTGDLPDQSALLGVLMRLHNLNLTILTVQLIEKKE